MYNTFENSVLPKYKSYYPPPARGVEKKNYPKKKEREWERERMCTTHNFLSIQRNVRVVENNNKKKKENGYAEGQIDSDVTIPSLVLYAFLSLSTFSSCGYSRCIHMYMYASMS